MEFPSVEIKAIRANIGNGTLTLTFEAVLDELTLETAQDLAGYGSKVDLIIDPIQAKLPGLSEVITHLVEQP